MPLQAYLESRQNSVSYGCKTEVPISLTSTSHFSFKLKQCLLEPSQASDLCLLLLARERARLLLLRDHVIRLDLPLIIQYNVPILKSAG